MRRRWRSFVFDALLLASLVALGQDAQAGPAMFSASFLIEAIGNDVTTGTAWPYDTSTFVALPLGHACGQADPYTVSGAPSSRYCSPATLQAGQPATGPRSPGPSMLSTTGAGGVGAGILMPKSAFGVTAAGSLRARIHATYYLTYSYLQSATYAAFVNDAGSFFAGNGPAASGTVIHAPTGIGRAGWVIMPGANAFGGAMGLLGKLGAVVKYVIPGGHGTWVASGSRYVAVALGRAPYATPTATTPKGKFTNWLNPHLGTRVYTNTYYTWQTDRQMRGTGTRWTTGKVTIYGFPYASTPCCSFSTILHRSGYDKSAAGVRNIQLVTPAITHQHGYFHVNRGHVGVIKLTIAPEPDAFLMLFLGAGVLIVLRWRFQSSSCALRARSETSGASIQRDLRSS